MVKVKSPLEAYQFLPQTNCGDCGFNTCMAFAAQLIERTKDIEDCPYMKEPKYKEKLEKLKDYLAPLVSLVRVGVGDNQVLIGGEEVLYRHELTYYNKTAIAIEVTDEMKEDEIIKRSKFAQDFTKEYIGMILKLEMVAIRSVSKDAEKFKKAVKTVADNVKIPLILCSFDPKILEAGLEVVKDRRPLIYAATRENWEEVGKLALKYNVPLAVFAPNDLELMRSITRALLVMGIEEIVLDPGTYPQGEGISTTVNNLVMLRRAAIEEGQKDLGFPLMTVPAVAWLTEGDDITKANLEAIVSNICLVNFSDLMILHCIEPWMIIPLITLRENLYTDPRRPVSVEPGLKEIGSPTDMSPVMFTTNFALTYYTVASDIESGNIDCWLLVVDTEGIGVESAVAGGQLNASRVKETMDETKIEEKVKHRTIVIPGMAARITGELEDISGWKVVVGPRDSSGIPKLVSTLELK